MNALEAVFRMVCDVSWRAGCLILIFLALRSLLRGQVSARVLFWVWIAIVIRLLVPVVVPVKWSPFDLTPAFGRDAAAFPADSTRVEPAQPAATVSSSTPTSSLPAAVPARFAVLSTVQWAAVAWGIGAAVLLTGRCFACFRFARRTRRPTAATNPARTALVTEAASRLGVPSAEVIVTDAVGAPALHGIFRPKLLFPPGLLESLCPHEIHFIIAHELGHHRRRDLLVLCLLHFARSLHWFNPLVWIAARAARHDCELACDEYVVGRLGSTEPEVYGLTLLKTFGLVSRTPRGALGLGVVESKQQLKRRIQMIIANKPPSLMRTLLACAVLSFVAGLSLTRETRAQQPAGGSEGAVTTTAPKGWWKNGTKNAAAYVVGLDRNQSYQGQLSAYVRSIEPAIDGFGGMMQMCNAEQFLGKRLRFSAWMKTENANDGGAHLWFRVDGKERGVSLQFDNMDNRPVKGTTEWQLYSVVLDVPQNASALAYGIFVNGTGQAWMSGVKMEVVGMDVPSTNMVTSSARSLPDAPVNLSFN